MIKNHRSKALLFNFWRIFSPALFVSILIATLWMFFSSYQQTLETPEDSFSFQVVHYGSNAVDPTEFEMLLPERREIKGTLIAELVDRYITHWSKIRLTNLTKTPQTVYLLIDNPTVEEIDFWVVNSKGDSVAKSSIGHGRDLPATSDYSLPRMMLTLPPLTVHTVTVRTSTNLGASTPISIFSATQMREYKESALLLWGNLLGLSFIMIMYLISLYRAVNESIFIVYSVFTLLAFIFLSLFYGFGFHIWPVIVQRFLLEYMGSILLMLMFSIVFFTRNFVILSGSVSLQAYKQIAVAGILIFVSFFLPSRWVLMGAFALQPILFLYLVVITCLTLRRHIWTRYYLYSWFPIFISLPVSTMAYLGLSETNLLTRNFFLLAVMAQLAITALFFSERMKLTEQKRIYQTTHDRYTQLPNRSALTQTLAQSIQDDTIFSLVLLEVGNFLRFLPYVGAERASGLILEVAMLIRNHKFRNTQLLPQPEGSLYIPPYLVRDHVLALLIQQKDVEIFMSELYNLCNRDVLISDIEIAVSPIVAAVHSPRHSQSADELIQKSMQALDYAKREGLKFSLYREEKIQHSEIEVVIATDLRRAIQMGEMQLYHQPQVSLQDFSIFGSEVLLRWIHPDLGFVPPEMFVKVAEDIGIINELTKWVLEQAFVQQKQIIEQGYNHHVSINISGKDITSEDFYDCVKSLLEKYQMNPEMVTLELTESITIEDKKSLKQLMEQFETLGIRFSIDDFGTGYSSLEALSELSFGELKIDRAFVQDMLISERNHIISVATIELANRLNLNTVAEGVENEKVIFMLKASNCEVAQGYYFSKPKPFDEYLDWLKKET